MPTTLDVAALREALAEAQEREALNGDKWREEHARAEAAEARLARLKPIIDRGHSYFAARALWSDLVKAWEGPC